MSGFFYVVLSAVPYAHGRHSGDFAICEIKFLTGSSRFAKMSAYRLGPLHIISHKRLVEASRKYKDAGVPLDAWYRTAKIAEWKNLDEVRRTYPHADGVRAGERVYTVFNVAGNKYRLVTEIYYEDQTILVRHVLTHVEYDREEWKRK